MVGKVHVVLIKEEHELAARKLNTFVMGRRLMPGVGRQVVKADAWIGEGAYRLLGLGVAAVPDDDRLPILKIRAENASDREAYDGGPVVGRNDNRDRGIRIDFRSSANPVTIGAAIDANVETC